MTFFLFRANAKLLNVICACVFRQFWTELTPEEQPEQPELSVSQTVLYAMYNPLSDLAVCLALLILPFLLRLFSRFASQKPQAPVKGPRRRARGKSPVQLRRSARLAEKAQTK